jgi:hypothetical protein
VIFFGYELVEAGLRLEQRGIQRYLGSIARMQVELATVLKGFAGSYGISRRGDEAA